LVGEEEREDFGGGLLGVGGRERRRRLREQEKGNQACCLWEKSRRSYMQDCSVKLHFANHWDSTGTWRKMSI
jgi:hypothetical protein